VGTIGLIDYDIVSESNLNRQVLYEEKNLGQLKVEAAAERLKGLNRNVCINTYAEKINRSNLAQISNIISGYDIVVDCCDNMETRYIVSDITESLSIPFVYGAIEGFCGYVSVFNDATCLRRLRDLWPEEVPQTYAAVPGIGTCAGVIGTLQANEAIKWICGFGERLSGKLMTVDLCRMEFNVIEL
jgi:adenylyltransferase/sulfurtransferase